MSNAKLKLENIDDLRADAILLLDRLRKKEVSIEEAGTTHKIYENILSTVKIQLAYSALRKEALTSDFIEGHDYKAIRTVEEVTEPVKKIKHKHY